ncbi:MAG: protein-S-isoprenylcysteine O-methyltransferase [Bacteroidota bacterium]
MNPLLLKIGFFVIVVGTGIIRYPHEKRNKANQVTTDKKKGLEQLLLFFVFLGMMILPMLYIFTSWLSFADYQLPVLWQVLGLVLIVPGLWLFYRSHYDLGRNWSVSLEIREGHNIVNSGVYKLIRHPMYLAIFLLVIAQALLLNNYVAGPAGLLFFGLLYLLRVGREEKMMIQQFGEEYVAYMKSTKRIIPYLL